MRLKTLATSAALAWCGFALPIPAFAQTAGPSALTLDQAWRLAESANPQIRSKRAQTAAAEGLGTDARSWFNANPQLTVDQTRRTVPRDGLPNERWHEWNTGISQTLEVAGQQGHRREAAAAGLTALRNEIEDTRREVHAEVSEQFFRVLALQQRIELEAKALALFEGTASAVLKRRAAGEDTRLDANVALVEAERARTQLALAQEQSTEARTRLASLLQLPLGAVPPLAGTLDAVRAPYAIDDLLRSVDDKPRLQALAAREDSASARLRLERASTHPDITVGVSVGREGASFARDRRTTVSVSVPLPLFKRNAAGIGQATTELSQTQIERQAAGRDARAQVSGLWSRLTSLEARVKRFQATVLPAIDDNQQLAAKSQRAGQIGLLELIVINRQALDARRDLLDALTDYHATRIALERAAGWFKEGTTP